MSRNPRHGTNYCYQQRCRRPECSGAHSDINQSHRIRTTITGRPILIDAATVQQQLRDLLGTGLTQHEVADLCHLSNPAAPPNNRGRAVRGILQRNTKVRAATARKIQAAWDLYCKPIPKDTRRYPGEPLAEAVRKKYGSLYALGDTERRHIARLCTTGLSAVQADRWAIRYGFLPSELWPEYNESSRPVS